MGPGTGGCGGVDGWWECTCIITSDARKLKIKSKVGRCVLVYTNVVLTHTSYYLNVSAVFPGIIRTIIFISMHVLLGLVVEPKFERLLVARRTQILLDLSGVVLVTPVLLLR